MSETRMSNPNDSFNLSRFLQAQDNAYSGYSDALQEVKDGCKRKHWIWYVFPQIKGLGHSYNSHFYAIGSLEEAAAYLENEVLGKRLREISATLLQHDGKTAVEILGSIDARKVKSCMTLFDIAAPDDVFRRVLEKYYNGQRCSRTLHQLNKR